VTEADRPGASSAWPLRRSEASPVGARAQLAPGVSERSVFIEAAGPAVAGQAWGLALCAAVVRHRR